MPPEQRDTARRLFDEGTRLLKESLFQQAVDKFKAALTHWDHPAIHYNMALALLNLNDPLSLHEHLRQALRYGPKPFEEDKFNVAKGYLRLVENQLATVDLSCNEPGAVVTFDGREMFTAPGHQTFLVVPGAHIAAASKAGARPTEWTRILVAGETTTFDLKVDMNATRDNVIAAVALAIAAGGIATGLVLDRLANDSEASAYCPNRECQAGEYSKIQTAWLERSCSRVAYATAGLSVVGGLAYLVYRFIQSDQQSPTIGSITPMLTPERSGLWFQGAF